MDDKTYRRFVYQLFMVAGVIALMVSDFVLDGRINILPIDLFMGPLLGYVIAKAWLGALGK